MWRATITHPNLPAGVPNFYGRPFGKSAPTSIDHLYPDQPQDTEVFLSVFPSSAFLTRQESPWNIAWIVGEHHYQNPRTGNQLYFHIIRRIGLEQVPNLPYLTFWGPITQSIGFESWNQRTNIKIGSLTHQGRQVLEELARNIPVQLTTPNWNGQNWMMSLLRAAEGAGLFTSAQVSNVVAIARGS